MTTIATQHALYKHLTRCHRHGHSNRNIHYNTHIYRTLVLCSLYHLLHKEHILNTKEASRLRLHKEVYVTGASPNYLNKCVLMRNSEFEQRAGADYERTKREGWFDNRGKEG